MKNKNIKYFLCALKPTQKIALLDYQRLITGSNLTKSLEIHFRIKKTF